MSKAVKLGDIGTDHDGFPPTKVIAGSPDVFFDGKPAARVGDPLEPHDKPKNPKHSRAIATGSSTVFVNGKPAALTGGKVSCGGITVGSGTVNISDQTSGARVVPPVVEPFNIQLAIKDKAGTPIPNYHFIAELEDGSAIEGVTDSDGLSEIIAEADHVQNLKIKNSNSWLLRDADA